MDAAEASHSYSLAAGDFHRLILFRHMIERVGIHDQAFLLSNSERQCSLINPEAQSDVTVFCGSGGALSSPRTQPLVSALDQKLNS